MQIQPVTSDIADSLGLKSDKGALVADTEKNSPASKAGIKTGDVILGVNGEQVDGPRELARKIAALGPECRCLASGVARRRAEDLCREARHLAERSGRLGRCGQRHRHR